MVKVSSVNLVVKSLIHDCCGPSIKVAEQQ